jgi:glycosyltransferase involved in cell wall biosynthesis
MSVLEGLSHGLTVITTPVGAHLEVIEPEVSGLFVTPGDVTALADALVRVIDDESLRRPLAKGARDRFVNPCAQLCGSPATPSRWPPRFWS